MQTTYLVTKLDGTTFNISLPVRDHKVGSVTVVMIGDVQMRLRYTGSAGFQEIVFEPDMPRWKAIVILCGMIATVIGTVGLTIYGNLLNIGNAPDDAVMRAVEFANLKDVTVGKSQLAFMGQQGCDNTDRRAYPVIDNKTGNQIGVVCRGSELQMWGAPGKGPTLRAFSSTSR